MLIYFEEYPSFFLGIFPNNERTGSPPTLLPSPSSCDDLRFLLAGLLQLISLSCSDIPVAFPVIVDAPGKAFACFFLESNDFNGTSRFTFSSFSVVVVAIGHVTNVLEL